MFHNRQQERRVSTREDLPPGNNPDGDFVLGLYYKDDSRKLALAWKYPDNGTVRFRGWKTTLSSLSFGNL
jgi:hypothetical protein